jgi:hypothetical protein
MKKITAIALAIFALALVFGAGAVFLGESQSYLEPIDGVMAAQPTASGSSFCPVADPGCRPPSEP